jgi:hypothetical protein
MSLFRLSRRESWWKDAEILMLRHQLAVAERERPKARARLTWPDRAWLALLADTVPAGSLAGCGCSSTNIAWSHRFSAPTTAGDRRRLTLNPLVQRPWSAAFLFVARID